MDKNPSGSILSRKDSVSIIKGSTLLVIIAASIFLSGFFVFGNVAQAADVTISPAATTTIFQTSVDPTPVTTFSPSLGDSIPIGTDVFYGIRAQSSTSTPIYNVIWKLTIDGPAALNSDMVTVENAGWFDLNSCITATDNPPCITYPGSTNFDADVNGDLISTSTILTFDVNPNDDFTSIGKIHFNPGAPVGPYAITYQIIGRDTGNNQEDSALFASLTGPDVSVSDSISATVTLTAPVVDTTTGAGYRTIQSAIDAATSGDTINVAAGTYAESVIVDKSLTLSGDRGDANITGPGDNAPVLDGSSLLGVSAIRISAGVSDVTIEGFEIANYGPTGNTEADAINAWDSHTSNITVRDNYFHNLGWNGILVGSEDGSISTGWVVQRNKVDHAPYAGIELTNVTGSSVTNNEVAMWTGSQVDPGDSGVGIEIAVRDHGSVMTAGIGNTVSYNQITGGIETDRAGINILSRAYVLAANAVLDGVTIQNNTISGNATRGISIAAEARNGSSATISHLDINNNPIDHNDVGIHLGILGSGLDGVYSDTISISDNSITDNTTKAVENATLISVNATPNWWGTASSTQIEAKKSGSVIFSPWYADAAMTKLAIETTTNPDGSVSSTIAGTTTTTIPVSLGAVSSTVSVDIPAGIIITGPYGWDGTFTLPQVTATFAQPVPDSRYTASVISAIEVGFGDTLLTFNKGVRLFFAGQGGASVGYSRGGAFTPITNPCDADSQATADLLPDGGDCKISVNAGADLVVWTKHFTTFITYGQTLIPASGGVYTAGGAVTTVTTPTPTTTPATPTTPAPTTPAGQVLGATTFNFVSDLKPGMKGDAVTELQKRLADESVYSGPITGYFGPLTAAGVKAYQEKYGISPVGVVGPLTRAQLNGGQVAGAATVNVDALREQIASLQSQLIALLQQLQELLKSQVQQ